MRSARTYYLYILASGPNGTLYTGMTNDLSRRVFEHREGLVDGFTKKTASRDWCISRNSPPRQTRFIAKNESRNIPVLGRSI
jgi:predicted GIY-YIG superfamily endonuclease